MCHTRQESDAVPQTRTRAGAQEHAKHAADPGRHSRVWEGVNAKSGARFGCEVGAERFLGPEILFRPALATSEPAQPLPEVLACGSIPVLRKAIKCSLQCKSGVLSCHVCRWDNM